MELSKEEQMALAEVLSADEDVNLFIKVNKGATKFNFLERLQADLSGAPAKKEKQKAAEPEEEDDDIPEPRASRRGIFRKKGKEDIIIDDDD